MTIDTAQSGRNVDLSLWKNHQLAKDFRREINKADRLIKLHSDTKELEVAVSRLKKGLVLGWDYLVLEDLHNDLKIEIDELDGG